MSITSTPVTTRDGMTIRRWERGDPTADDAVFFVHGATYGGRAAFAPDGVSWLDAVADAGRAAYTVDVRGYGDSDRPPELDAPSDANDPVVRAHTAARDVADALDGVRDRHDRVHLVGYSWGTIIAGVLLTDLGVAVRSLTQYAPVYRPPAGHRDRFSPDGAYRTLDEDDVRDRWAAQRPDGTAPEDAFDAFWRTVSESGQRAGPGEILAPNGTLVDLTASITDGALYDAGAIDVPTLVVRGSLDTASVRADALSLYDDLGSERTDYVELAGGTHFLQFESRRHALYDVVRRFQDRV